MPDAKQIVQLEMHADSPEAVPDLDGSGRIVFHKGGQHGRLHAAALQHLLVILNRLDDLQDLQQPHHSQWMDCKLDVHIATIAQRNIFLRSAQAPHTVQDWFGHAAHFAALRLSSCGDCPVALSHLGLECGMHTFCWSAGSRGPSKAGARMAGPALLCSGASSGSSSGMDGSGAHQRVRPADAQVLTHHIMSQAIHITQALADGDTEGKARMQSLGQTAIILCSLTECTVRSIAWHGMPHKKQLCHQTSLRLLRSISGSSSYRPGCLWIELDAGVGPSTSRLPSHQGSDVPCLKSHCGQRAARDAGCRSPVSAAAHQSWLPAAACAVMSARAHCPGSVRARASS